MRTAKRPRLSAKLRLRIADDMRGNRCANFEEAAGGDFLAAFGCTLFAVQSNWSSLGAAAVERNFISESVWNEARVMDIKQYNYN